MQQDWHYVVNLPCLHKNCKALYNNPNCTYGEDKTQVVPKISYATIFVSYTHVKSLTLILANSLGSITTDNPDGSGVDGTLNNVQFFHTCIITSTYLISLIKSLVITLIVFFSLLVCFPIGNRIHCTYTE